MGRTVCCSTAEGLKKGAWSSDEDKVLTAYIQKHGEGGWRTLPLKAGLQRCGKSCRLRWTNYLRPDIKRGNFSPEEEHKIIQLHATFGNRWSAIAKEVAKRTDNEIKNYWHSHLKKRVAHTKCKLAKHCTKSSSLNNNQNNIANNVIIHSSQDYADDMVSCRTQDPPSASAKLLNKLGTTLPSSCCHGSSTQFDGKSVVSISDASRSGSNSRPCSSSVRFLLNKLAHGINGPTIYLEMVKSILSKGSNRGTCTSIGDDLFYTSEIDGETWMPPTMSMPIEVAENLASDVMLEDVPSRGVQNDRNGNASIESLIKDLDFDFFQEWTMMDDDDNGTCVIGGGSYEDGVLSTCINSDRHDI